MNDDTGAAPDPTDSVDGSVPDGSDVPEVTLYWRPGCGFCAALRRGLQRGGVPVTEVNIWDDPAAAGFVRRHADGNETVPTVDVAGTVLVNPRAGKVVELARAAGVDVVEPERNGWWRRRGGDAGTSART